MLSGMTTRTPQRTRGVARRARLARARLYLVCDARPGGRDPVPVLRAALEAGVDMVQLRDKTLDDAGLERTAATFQGLCAEHDALFVLNDRPDLAVALDADGVHVGQGDAPLARARGIVGDDRIIGVSTHAPEQLAATGGADYAAVGPVWETPTKPGRPAVGLAYVRHAADAARLPWFAIGGIDPGNVGDVVAAGARRIVVVRAIADAPDPAAAARALAQALPVPEAAR